MCHISGMKFSIDRAAIENVDLVFVDCDDSVRFIVRYDADRLLIVRTDYDAGPCTLEIDSTLIHHRLPEKRNRGTFVPLFFFVQLF